MKTSITLSTTTNVEKLAAELQTKCLIAREHLFYDPIRFFDHNMGGVRTRASLEDVTKRIDAITNGFITFHFVSHRRLWFEIEGVDKRYTLHCANEYDFRTKESAVTNPYNKIAAEVIMALKERNEMERTYQLLIAA
jgi:hypothetical protein